MAGEGKSTKTFNRVLVNTSRWGRYFKKDIGLNQGTGHAAQWAKPLATARDGRIYMGTGRKLIGEHGGAGKWDANIAPKSYSISKDGKIPEGAAVLKGDKDWIRQLEISIHQLNIESENFRIAIGHVAEKVFNDAFLKQSFEGERWQALAPYTLRKRERHGTLSKPILAEYGDLKKSLTFLPDAIEGGKKVTQIHTGQVKANPKKHKKHTLCYAGWHNEGEGTYGSGIGHRAPKPYVKRQFIGHGKKILDFMAKTQKRYLFDAVFLQRRPK